MDDQIPDTKPGNYYVSVFDPIDNAGHGPIGLLLGPFQNDHARALSLVEAAKSKALEVNDRAEWYAYGTLRMPLTFTRPGVLNLFFDL